MLMIELPTTDTAEGKGNNHIPQDQKTKDVEPVLEGRSIAVDEVRITHDPPIVNREQNLGYKEGFGSFVPPMNQLDFKVGTVEVSESGTSGKSRNSRNMTSWYRRKRSSSGQPKDTVANAKEVLEKKCDRVVKRKVVDDAEVSSKLSKSEVGLMVHHKPSNHNT